MKPLKQLIGLFFFFCVSPTHAADYPVSCSDVNCLVQAINDANSEPVEPLKTIILAPGKYEITSSAFEETFFGQGLVAMPMVKSHIKIIGAGSTTTKITTNLSFRIFFVDVGATLELEDLKLSDGGAGNKQGGCIYNRGTLLVTHAKMQNCSALLGGAIYNQGSIELTDSELSDNTAFHAGGAIYNHSGTILIEASRISRNDINPLDPDASSVESGGGIFTLSGSVKILNSIIDKNSATNNGTGGGIHADLAKVEILQSTIAFNDAKLGAGLYVGGNVESNPVTITNSTFSLNFAHQGGGAIFNDSGYVKLLNATIASNTSQSVEGGGIWAFKGNGPGYTSVKNTLIADNLGKNVSSNCHVVNTVIESLGHNLDEDGTCNLIGDTNKSGVDPLLGALQNNGGVTPTHALLAGSPAIDAAGFDSHDQGVDAGCPSNDQRIRIIQRPETQQPGAIRPADGNQNGTPTCDIGAFEYQPPTLTLAAEADTYVRTDGFRSEDNYGLQDFIEVGNDNLSLDANFPSPDVIRALIRFNTSFLPTTRFNLTSAVLNATLHSFDNGRSLPENEQSPSVYTVEAHFVTPFPSLTPWLEGNGFEGAGGPPGSLPPSYANGVTWDSQPLHQSTVTATQFVYQGHDNLLVRANEPGDIFKWDITSSANNWATSRVANNGFMLLDPTTDDIFRGVRFGSRDGKRFNQPNSVDGPKLVLTWTPGTNPADLSGDNCVSSADLKILLAVINGQGIAGNGLKIDQNGDGKVNIADSRKLVTLFTNPLGAACNQGS